MRNRYTLPKPGFQTDLHEERLAAVAHELHAAGAESVIDPRFGHFNAAVMVETIEHLDPRRLSALEHALFALQRPRTVVITTPNQDYNVLYGLPPRRR